MKIRIGTRKSQLALWQANYIAKLLKKTSNVDVEIVKITTSGDKILDVPLAKIGGKGLFVKEIEDAMLKGDIDVAVHSLKDVPTQLPDGLGIVAITKREDPRDAFLSTKYKSLYELPKGAVVGTSSLRRKSQIMKIRDDLQIKDLRGNVDTRIRKLEEGQYDAIILAYAGLKRLGLDSKVSYVFSPDEMIPAVCQGFLGIEARLDDEKVLNILQTINDRESFIRATAERSFLKTLEGGCQVPLGAYCEIIDGDIKISGFIADLEGKRFIKETLSEKISDDSLNQAKDLGEKLANILIKKGGKEILTEIYKM
ncbi:hydroxymethylbilane synthase [Sulfurihydrogenibium sp.]|uniref:hydroxymethylbilane synthase n=1 Tax=Sulfurihydrogenibium sp. TaxID=2053621 RepID=UPI002602F6BE|nr:hydroxymethylbilane synthase [Sulfurihydrogenibium sp.]